MKHLLLLSLALYSLPCLAAGKALGIVEGKVKVVDFGDYKELLVDGEFLSVPAQCQGAIQRGQRLDATVNADQLANPKSCEYAKITLDLSSASACRDPEDAGYYLAPKAIKLECAKTPT